MKMSNKFKIFLFLSLIVTLPINIFFSLWIYQTASVYYDLDKFRLTLNKGTRLKGASETVFYDLKNNLFHLLGIKIHTDVNFILNDSNLNQLSSDLPLSGADYKDKALLIVDNKAFTGKVKIRGDNFYHWAFPRKSWRFKTSKSNTYNNTRKINLIIPKSENLITNHVSYQLARQLNLLAPQSRLVDFSINGVYKGIRLMVGQIDENFLRKNNIMPSDIYKGDNVGQKQYLGLDVLIFNNPSIWEKHAVNNHYSSENIYPLKQMLSELSLDQHRILDIKSFAAMAAFIDLTTTYHFDNRHNWILYYDNYLEKFFPIIWDTSGWFTVDVPRDNVNIITSELLSSLYHNYDFIREKYSVLKSFYLNRLDDFNSQLQESIDLANEFIDRNGYTFSLGKHLLKKKAALESVEIFKDNVDVRIKLINEYFLGKIIPGNYKYALLDKKIRFSVSGNKMINKIVVKLKREAPLGHVRISYKQGEKTLVHNIDDRVSMHEKQISIQLNILANAKYSSIHQGTKLEFIEATYDVELDAIDNSNIESLSFTFDNLKNEDLLIDQVESLPQLAFDEGISQIIAQSDKIKTIKWSGIKYIDGLTIIEDNLIIEAGTQLFFSKDASLKILAKITAIGSAEQPIIIQAQDSNIPWGAFVLKGDKANGSVFKHTIFKGGSGYKGKLFEYTAMLSIHDVDDVLIEDSAFYDSKITDDMVHIIYADVKFLNTKFVRSNADALDVDISTVVVENCQFINSGNDSIDLMTAKAVVINTTFIDSLDKGVSIGEGSKLLAVNNLFEGNEIGVQSKDNSQAFIYDTTFNKNKKAVDAYHKNWRYSEGGSITVDNCVMNNNDKNATVGKKSKITLNNCDISGAQQIDAKSINKKKIIVSTNTRSRYDFDDSFFIDYENLVFR